jgi:SAM-dependent methyltransferase
VRALRREHRRPLRRLLAPLRSAAHPGTPRRLKPYAEAAERNRAPILAVLERIFRDRKSVLEIGSGTGQHAAYFSAGLPHLRWQASDVAEHIPGIREWVSDPPPVELDVDHPFPQVAIDAAFTANTCHILSWVQVERMFRGVAALLPPGGLFAVYGPFHYGGKPTADSNARFDRMLQAHDPLSGIRDFEAVRELARGQGLALEEDNPMPANNRLLVFRKRP